MEIINMNIFPEERPMCAIDTLWPPHIGGDDGGGPCSSFCYTDSYCTCWAYDWG